LRSYPAVLIFTAYGVGLTRSQRWQTLHELLVASWPREHREPRRVVSALFLWSWKGDEQDVWQQLDGFERRKTPLSDHLFDVMSSWRSSYAGMSSDFELIFERFETLAALAFLEENDEVSLEQAASNTPQGLFARMPVGRAGWHSSSATTLIHEFQSEATILALLNAGFAKRSRRFLELFVKNFERYIAKLSW
jgi:hypothetical protein